MRINPSVPFTLHTRPFGIVGTKGQYTRRPVTHILFAIDRHNAQDSNHAGQESHATPQLCSGQGVSPDGWQGLHRPL
jgi:hypothetical protein